MKGVMASMFAAVVFSGPVIAQRVQHGQEPPWPPAGGVATFFLTPPPGYLPESLDQLCRSSRLVIEGYIVATFPSWEISKELLETDAVVRVVQVVNGAEPASQIVVSQHGGSLGKFKQVPAQYALVQSGEHYLLFLANETRPNMPSRAGMPRYAITGLWAGTFQIDSGGVVHLPAGASKPMRDAYEGVTLPRVIGDSSVCALQGTN
jgi:hypothetical protein